MFDQGTHFELKESIEAIGASFAIFAFKRDTKEFVLVSSNELFSELMSESIEDAIGKNIISLFPRYIEKPLRKNLTQVRLNQAAM